MAESIYAEMGANVWKIVVSVGETIDAGEPIMILESMKMEIPVLTEDGGTVSALNVAEVDAIEEGHLLAVARLSLDAIRQRDGRPRPQPARTSDLPRSGTFRPFSWPGTARSRSLSLSGRD